VTCAADATPRLNICDYGQVAEPGNPISPPLLARIDAVLAGVDADLAARYSGDTTDPQPVYTVFISAAGGTVEERKHS
jgi:hypothetical protein